MKATDTYDDRLKMVEMHTDILAKVDTAIKNKQSIEACWLCYACFENRITRTLEKVSECCDKRICYKNKKVGITTRIDCLKRLRNTSYSGIEKFDLNLLGEIKAWCKDRNILVHELVTLNNYYGMDEKFLKMAEKGKSLVEKLYLQTTNFRNHYYNLEKMSEFPLRVCQSCHLGKKLKHNSANAV